RLEKPLRDALLPGRLIHDDSGKPRRLPRYFYEIPSWEAAMKVQLSPNFALWEFIQTDVREAAPLRAFTRYVPCAITLTALCLEQLRQSAGTFVHIAANGGYRSPRHSLNTNATPHSWGTAVNIYRVGDVFLDDRESIERYAALPSNSSASTPSGECREHAGRREAEQRRGARRTLGRAGGGGARSGILCG